MKKLMMTGVLVLSFGTVAFAATVRENCGCGLGAMALGTEEGLVSHVTGATLNGLSGNQTFGVSSGTLGCDKATKVTSTNMLDKFVDDNMDQLAQDIAIGSGDSLTALAVIMEVPAEQRASFNAALQNSFDTIFTSEEVTSDEVVDNLMSVI